MTDWTPEGDQRYAIDRKCHTQNYQSPPVDEIKCSVGTNPAQMTKDCYNICLGDGCNNNREVQSAHTRLDENGDPVEIECYDFASAYEDFDQIGQRTRKCPNFANWGCFTANFTARYQDDSYPSLTINQGCSMFELDEVEGKCNNLGSIGTACKSQCEGDFCNELQYASMCQGTGII